MKIHRSIIVFVLTSLLLVSLIVVLGFNPTLAYEASTSGPSFAAVDRDPLEASIVSSSVIPIGYNFPIAVGKGSEIQGKPAIAFDGTNFFAVWLDQSTYTLYGARVTPDGTVLDPSSITISTLDQESKQPSVVFDGTNFFVVWAGKRGGVNEVYGARVSTNGVVLDPSGIKITTGANPKIRMLGLAFDGTNMLVTWRTGSDHIYATRVSTGGANLDAPAGFAIAAAGGAYYPGVAFDGTNYMVAWHDSRSSLNGWDIYGARVTTDGTVLDPNGFLICDEEQNQEHSMIAFDGVNYLVVWYDNRRPNGSSTWWTAYAARVSPDGTVLDDPSFQISGRVHGQDAPRPICAGGECLVVYHVSQAHFNFRHSDIYGHRVSQAGELLDTQGIPVGTAFGNQFGPTVGYGDGKYLVAWGDNHRTGESVYAQLLEVQTDTVSAPVHQPRMVSHANFTDHATNKASDVWVAATLPLEFATEGIALSATNAFAFKKNENAHFTGTQWLAEAMFPGGIHGSWASAPDDVWVTGWCRGFCHYDGQSWESQGCWGSDDGWHIGTAIWGTNLSDLWVTADRGDMLRFDGYSGWTTISSGVPEDLAGIWGTSAQNIYAVGEMGTVLHYNGSVWSEVSDIPTFQTLNGIWGSGPDDIYIVGDWGEIIHYDGTTWSRQPSGTVDHLFDIWGSSGSDIYVAGLNGTILHYDGSDWQPEISNVDQDLWAIWGIVDLSAQSQVVWAAGYGNTILTKTMPITVYREFLPSIMSE